MELGYRFWEGAGTVDERRAAYRESLLHKELHTDHTFDSEHVGPNGKAATCSAPAEPFDGVEPSAPSRGIGRL